MEMLEFSMDIDERKNISQLKNDISTVLKQKELQYINDE